MLFLVLFHREPGAIHPWGLWKRKSLPKEAFSKSLAGIGLIPVIAK